MAFFYKLFHPLHYYKVYISYDIVSYLFNEPVRTVLYTSLRNPEKSIPELKKIYRDESSHITITSIKFVEISRKEYMNWLMSDEDEED